MRSTSLIATLAATATLGVAATAQADTYCVASPASCPAGATAKSGVQEALNAAQDHPGHDVVRIGSGEFTTAGGFQYGDQGVLANTVEIRGEGASTVLKANAETKNDNFTLFLLSTKEPSNLENVHLVAPAPVSGSTSGLSLSGKTSAKNIRLTGSATYGMDLDNGTLADSEIDMPGASAVRVAGTSSNIRDTRIRGARGILAPGGASVQIKRTQVQALYNGVFLNGGTMSIESSLVQVTGENGIGIESQGPTWAKGTLKASHVTVVGANAPGSKGIHADSIGAHDAVVEIDNSIIHGFAHNAARSDAGGAGVAKVLGTHVNYNPAADYSGGDGEITIANVTNLAPGFADAGAGDFRLPKTSPMIDKGRSDSYVTLAGEDLLRKARTRGAKRDLGAYEYQDAAPVAVLTGAADVEPGRTLSLSGAQSHDIDAKDAITFKWELGDGTTKTGQDVSHAWAADGTYTVKLTVTDTTGKSTTATASVKVASKPVDKPADSVLPVLPVTEEPRRVGDVVNPPADKTAPAITRLRRSGADVRVTLSEAAALTVRVEKQSGKRRFRAAGAAKRFTGKAGANTLKRAVRKLAPGRYRLVVTATDAAGNRTVKRVSFRVR